MTEEKEQLISASENALKVLVRLCRDRDEDFGTTLSDMRKAIERAKAPKPSSLHESLLEEMDGKDAELETLGVECDRRGGVINQYQNLLAMVRDYAHDASTGPAVPDALWEIRTMIDDGL